MEMVLGLQGLEPWKLYVKYLMKDGQKVPVIWLCDKVAMVTE